MIRSVVRNCTIVLFLVLTFVSGSYGQQSTLRIVGWNMEGNGNDIDPALLVKQLGIKQGVDIWGLSEVRPKLFDDFLNGAKIGEDDEFDIIQGKSGGGIRLAIIYNKSKLDLIKSDELFELFDLNENSNHRAPLIGHFRGKKTKQEFLFMVNHLASGDADRNKKQAEALVKWLKLQTLPVIETGDHNFFDDRPGFGIMKQVFFELEPLQDVPTFREPFNGRIDFVFVGNRDKAMGWSGTATVLKRATDEMASGTFKDTSKDTDHRPISAVFKLEDLPAPQPQVVEVDTEPLLQQLLERIEQLEERIRKLENR